MCPNHFFIYNVIFDTEEIQGLYSVESMILQIYGQINKLVSEWMNKGIRNLTWSIWKNISAEWNTIKYVKNIKSHLKIKSSWGCVGPIFKEFEYAWKTKMKRIA